jgi:hypothetical protein
MEVIINYTIVSTRANKTCTVGINSDINDEEAVVLEAKSKVAAMESLSQDPIKIIGLMKIPSTKFN